MHVPEIERERPVRAPGREPRPGGAGAAVPVGAAAVLRLQRLAGNRAAVRGLNAGLGLNARLGPLHPPRATGTIQRAPEGGSSAGVAFRGQMFTTDPDQLRTLLETLVGERGHAGMETLAYAFLSLTAQEKFSLQLAGADWEQIERVQVALRPALRTVQDDRRIYLAKFRAEAAAGTQRLLQRSREELMKERAKYLDNDGQPPDLAGLRAAANALAAQRHAADAAAAAAEVAFEKMRSQRQAPAHYGSFFPAPIMPIFPDPELRAAAGAAHQEWWRQEQQYGRLRIAHESRFPVLAMYASNEEGEAADRLEDLPTWGFFADTRLQGKIVAQCDDRIDNTLTAEADITDDPDRIWGLPRILTQTLRGLNAKPYQERWVKAEADRVQAEAAERAQLIATVTLALAVAAIILTAGAAAAPAGTLGAAVLSGLATGAQLGTAGLTIATAYQELKEYAFADAAQETSLDKAQSISGEDPSFLWLAITLVAAILDLAALRAAFAATKASIQAARTSRSTTTLTDELAAVPHVPRETAEAITRRVAAEIEALPATSPQTAAAALERLSGWGTLTAAERRAAVIDALAAGDPAAILARTGRNTRQLVEELGQDSAAAGRLWAALTRKAYDEVGPALRAIGPDLVLDDAAVLRIVSRKDIQQIKGQLLEEVMAVEMRRTLTAPVEDAARRSLLRGAEAEGTAQFIPGWRITDVHNEQLTDGLIAVLRGQDEIVVIRALESKAGAAARRGLSREAATKFAELPKSERDQLLRDAAAILRRRRPDLRSLSPDDIIRDHHQAVMDVVTKEFPQTSQWGQALRTSERLGADLDEAGRTVPAEILVDGVRRRVRFPGQEGRPRITGMLPSDLPQGRLAKAVTTEQGVAFDLQNVAGIDQPRLTSLSRQVATAKGLPTQ